MVKYLNKPYFLAVLICLFVFYSGLFSFPEINPLVSLISQSEIKFISGKIISSPVRLTNKKYYSCYFSVSTVESVSKIKSSSNGIITVFIPSEMIEALYPGKIFSIAKNTGTGLFDAGARFTFQGKFKNKIFYIQKSETSGYERNIFGKIDYFRAIFRLGFKKLMYSWNEAGGFLLALLSGSREYTEDSIKDAFKKSGISHILALSGMHLSLFSGIAMFIGKKSKRKKMSFIIRIIFLVLFTWFAGFSPSLLRAFICALLIIFSSIATKDSPDMILILCFSFLLQCVISPSDIKNYGFILSYSALAGILIFNKIIRCILSRFLSNYISASLSASIGAQIFTGPISLQLFGTFCPIGIIATCIVSPLITIFIYSGIFCIILSLIIPSISSASGIFMNFEYNIIKVIALFFSNVPFWSIN